MNFNRRNVTPFIIGGIVGLVLGLVISISGVVPGLGGTALPQNATYYQVPVSSMSDWLNTYYEEDANLTTLTSAVETAEGLVNELDIQQSLVENAEDVQLLLVNVHNALSGQEIIDTEIVMPEEPTGIDEEQASVCLALDDNPYEPQGPTMYLYITVPSGAEGSLPGIEDLPEEAEDSSEPKNDDLFWLLLDCYTPEDVQ